MDFKLFFVFLRKYKWALILIPLLSVAITYPLVKNLPKEYSSKLQISTGLLDPSKKILSTDKVDYFSISQQFSNIIEKFKAKKIVDKLSLNLIAHDLSEPPKSFRTYTKNLDSLDQKQKGELLEVIKEKLQSGSILTTSDNKGKYKLYDIVNSMGYGEEDLNERIKISHIENTDFIDVKFVSENPDLSAYAVNTLGKEFIYNYSADVNNNQNSSIALLDSLVRRKEQLMNAKNAALSTFKRTKGVLNLDEQSATVYSQISAYEAQRAQALREIQSNQGAILIIESKLRGSDPFIRGSSRSDNQDIIKLKRQLEIANSNLIDRNFNEGDQRKVDSISKLLSQKGALNAEENVLDPATSKQSLIQQKLTLEIAMQQAKSSIRSLDNQLRILRARYQTMVPFDADIQNYEREAELATKEYTTALDQYNSSRTQQNIGIRFQIEQAGIPGNPEPSKQGLYLAGAGTSSLIFCIGFLFVLFVLDTTISTAHQLEHATGSRAIGSLPLVDGNEASIRNIWNDASGDKDHEVFKDAMRSLRFEVSRVMDVNSSKVLGITSINHGEGKTFASFGLAYAFAMTGKKVLLIVDDQPKESIANKELATSVQNFQNFLMKKTVQVEDMITVMNKTTEKNSLFEIQTFQNLQIGFDILKGHFDVIIIDVNSLADMNITKEWLLFTENTIAVFEAGRSLKAGDKGLLEYINSHSGFIGWVLNKVTQPNGR